MRLLSIYRYHLKSFSKKLPKTVFILPYELTKRILNVFFRIEFDIEKRVSSDKFGVPKIMHTKIDKDEIRFIGATQNVYKIFLKKKSNGNLHRSEAYGYG